MPWHVRHAHTEYRPIVDTDMPWHVPTTLYDSEFCNTLDAFANPMELIHNLVIDGKKLIDIIDELEDVEPM